MSLKAELHVDLGNLSCIWNGISLGFFASSSGLARVMVLAAAEDERDAVTIALDSDAYADFKNLFRRAENTVRTLRGCKSLMPPRELISLPMRLEIDVDALRLDSAEVRCTLQINDSGSVELITAYSDRESSSLVIVRMNETDYRRFRDLINGADDAIARACQAHQIHSNFLMVRR